MKGRAQRTVMVQGLIRLAMQELSALAGDPQRTDGGGSRVGYDNDMGDLERTLHRAFQTASRLAAKEMSRVKNA